MGNDRDPLDAAQRRIRALEAVLAEERARDEDAPRAAIARNPRRAWPLAVVVGLPVAVAIGFTIATSRLFPGDRLGSAIATMVALPAMIVGCSALVVPPQARKRAGALLAIAAGALVAGFLRDARAPGSEMPSGWSSKLPRYPGVLVAAEACSEAAGGATFRTSQGGGRNRPSYTIGYERTLREAGLAANRYEATCPALGVDCSNYRAASLEILECYTDSTKATVRVRYGAVPCPSK